ncbi:MAG: ATPase, T2SS/T4P/T4SS family [Pseudomonadota bacterium]
MQKLIEHLLKNKIINQQQAVIARNNSSNGNSNLCQWLIHDNIIAAEQLAKVISDVFKLTTEDIGEYKINDALIKRVGIKKIIALKLLPLRQDNHALSIAIYDPAQLINIDQLRFQVQQYIKPVIVSYSQLMSVIKKLEITQYNSSERHLHTYQVAETTADNHYKHGPIITYVNNILQQAIDKQATDIHFEHCQHVFRIRFRVDGLLHTLYQPNQEMSKRIISRLKIMAKLDIAEQRLPQDGQFKYQAIDVRVSSCPTRHGEKIVARLLNHQHHLRELDQLGFTPQQQQVFVEAINKPQGLILVTGPTGSGKTSTLYAALQSLNSEHKNICTVEDPIEITLPDINQVNVIKKAGLDFAHVLRALLRQDPDIIMIGEIRDLETAEIAIRAAQTGHLVLSTLHTNSSKEAITRLINIGINLYDLISSVRLITAQRLLRKLCQHCQNNSDNCQYCFDGYQGRLAVHELLSIDNNAFASLSSSTIIHQIQQQKIDKLQDQADQLITQGLTSKAEVKRVIAT